MCTVPACMCEHDDDRCPARQELECMVERFNASNKRGWHAQVEYVNDYDPRLTVVWMALFIAVGLWAGS